MLATDATVDAHTKQNAKAETVYLVGFGGTHGSTKAELARAYANKLYKRNGHVMVANASLAELIAVDGYSQALGYSPYCTKNNFWCAGILLGYSHAAKVTNDRAEIQEVAKGGGESDGTGGWWLCEVTTAGGDAVWEKALAEVGEPAKGACAGCAYNFPAGYGTLINMNDDICRQNWCQKNGEGTCTGTCMNCNLWPTHLGITENPDATGVHTYWMRQAHIHGHCYCYKNGAVVADSNCANQKAKNVKDSKPLVPYAPDIAIGEELSKMRDASMQKWVEEIGELQWEF